MADNVRWTQTAVVAALRDWAQRYGEVSSPIDWDRWAAYEHCGAGKVARLVEHPTPLPSVTTVIMRFGSWKAAIAAAGLEARSVSRRLDASVIRETVALYASGLSAREVGERLGVAPKTVRDRLHAAGVTLRPPRPRTRRPPAPRREATVLAVWRSGATQREIADRLGVSLHSVQQTLRRRGMTGSPLIRRLHAQLSRMDELDLTERQRDVIELVVAQRRTRREVAERLGISPRTIHADLRAVDVRVPHALD